MMKLWKTGSPIIENVGNGSLQNTTKMWKFVFHIFSGKYIVENVEN